MQKQRNTTIEILRILAMFMIVVGHTFTHGHASDAIRGGQIDTYLKTIVTTFSIPGTNIFVLISGYFMIKSKPSIKRIVLVWGQMLFYSLGIYIILVTLKIAPLSIGNLVKSTLPVSFGQYWFMRVYFYLVLCFPFLNVLVNHLSKRGHQYLICLGIILMVIPASIPGISVFNGDAGNGILWFFMLYVTGAYFSKYPPTRGTKVYALGAIGMFFAAFSSQILIGAISECLGFGDMGSSRFSTFDSFPIYIESCCILCVGICLSRFEIQNKIVNKGILFLSGSTAGVYMIHEHPLMRSLIWDYLDLPNHSIIYAIAVSVVIYIACSMIDFVTWKRIVPYISKLKLREIAEIELTTVVSGINGR